MLGLVLLEPVKCCLNSLSDRQVVLNVPAAFDLFYSHLYVYNFSYFIQFVITVFQLEPQQH